MKRKMSLIALFLCMACLCSCTENDGMEPPTVSVVDGYLSEREGAQTTVPITDEATTEETTSAASGTDASRISYVLNTNTKKFHYPRCSSVKQMADKNRKNVTTTREEIIAMGYASCGRCNP